MKENTFFLGNFDISILYHQTNSTRDIDEHLKFSGAATSGTCVRGPWRFFVCPKLSRYYHYIFQNKPITFHEIITFL